MQQIELSEELKVLYSSQRKDPFLVDVPMMHYLTYDGNGHPSEADFQTACEALFNLAYIIKFKVARKQLGVDYKVSPMEVDWFLEKQSKPNLPTVISSSDDDPPIPENKARTITYTWKMMIMQPEFITPLMYGEAIVVARQSKPDIPFLKVHFEEIPYGKCIQCFHLGDYLKMNDTLAKMKAYGTSLGLSTEPFTHDVYLNDSRKTKPENLKAIMRVKVLEK